MKPIYQKLTAEPEEGFVYRDRRGSGYDCPWHFHPEYELVLVLSGGGYRVVGDNITPIAPGDLVFLGPMLPHIWQNETAAERPQPSHHRLLQFEARSFGDSFLGLPAMTPIRRLLERATRGLQVVGPTRDRVSALMSGLENMAGFARLVRFLEILGTMAESDDCHPIASLSFVAHPDLYDQDVINSVFKLLNSEQGCHLRLPEVARLTGMSAGAFSRFFRLHTGRTFPEFRNELRVGRACRLLHEDTRNVTQIAYACGFSNLSNFNRQFLRLKSVSPSRFRRQMRQIF